MLTPIPLCMAHQGKVQGIVSNMTWILVNAEPLLDFPKPTLHNIVNVGGIGVAETKPLSQVQQFLFLLRGSL